MVVVEPLLKYLRYKICVSASYSPVNCNDRNVLVEYVFLNNENHLADGIVREAAEETEFEQLEYWSCSSSLVLFSK
uniref:Uncharacterized protein n=1 Tax=Solanum lycopersicum TaxID=4081 RepID=A0A3Q7ISL8_SOLLC